MKNTYKKLITTLLLSGLLLIGCGKTEKSTLNIKDTSSESSQVVAESEPEENTIPVSRLFKNGEYGYPEGELDIGFAYGYEANTNLTPMLTKIASIMEEQISEYNLIERGDLKSIRPITFVNEESVDMDSEHFELFISDLNRSEITNGRSSIMTVINKNTTTALKDIDFENRESYESIFEYAYATNIIFENEEYIVITKPSAPLVSEEYYLDIPSDYTESLPQLKEDIDKATDLYRTQNIQDVFEEYLN